MYAAGNPTKYVDPDGHEFTVNPDKKYGPNEVATPILSGKVSNADLKQYLAYVEKHGSRDQVVQATLGAAGVYSQAYGQQVAKMEAAAIAGTVAAAPVAIAGGSAVAVGAVGGGTQGFVSGLLDKASAAEVAVRTATGAVIGSALGWAAQKLGAVIYGEASPSVPGASQGRTTVPKPVSGEPAPIAESPGGKLPEYIGPERQLPAPSTARLSQDAAVNPNAPAPRALSRRIGSSPGQDAELRADIAAAQAQGAARIRVNQQQLDAVGNRVGTNRPDLQYTRPDGTRVHIEYDTPTSGRGRPHADRLLANDPESVVETKTIK